MRACALLLLAALLAAGLPTTAAQEDCTAQSTPCPWVVTVDANGFVGETSWTFTQDEWYSFTVENLDEASQTVTLSGYQVAVSAPGDADASTPVQFTQVGTFTLTHQGTGKTATLTIVAGDSIEDTGGAGGATGSTSKGAPAMGPVLALAGVGIALAVLLLRRR